MGEWGQQLGFQQYSGERTHRFRKTSEAGAFQRKVRRPTGQLAGHPVGRDRFKGKDSFSIVISPFGLPGSRRVFNEK